MTIAGRRRGIRAHAWMRKMRETILSVGGTIEKVINENVGLRADKPEIYSST
jgi:hypothetical protein